MKIAPFEAPDCSPASMLKAAAAPEVRHWFAFIFVVVTIDVAAQCSHTIYFGNPLLIATIDFVW